MCVLLLAVRLSAGSRRWRGGCLPAIWVVLVAGHYLDVTAPGLYGREFNLYWDSQHLGNVARCLHATAPWWLIASCRGRNGAGVVAWRTSSARLALGQVALAMRNVDHGALLGALAAIVLVLFAGRASSRAFPRLTWHLPIR